MLFSFAFSCKTSTNTKMEDSQHQYTNKLIDQSSPYLLQHAHNPVNWYPWGEEALAKAKEENKMILISVGYAACHWCHVMEHESFEDTAVAKIMNENFINIKVDREERPDVDDVYMTACQMATGKACGWPLNAFALPDGRPVWAGTYFPKKQWVEVMEYFIKTRKEEPEKLKEYAQQITDGIQNTEGIVLNEEDQIFEKAGIEKIGKAFMKNMDLEKGGRQSDIKFPMPNNWEFLLSYYHYTKDPKVLEAVETTLQKMANGGIYDHLGGGFSRYSTDPNWHVPHFEKMLYDNGQLVSLYAKAYQLTKDPLYKKVVEETIEFVERELYDDNGGFYSSLDADSEGEEGKFYVWTAGEIDSILTDEKTRTVFKDYYDIQKSGNWEHNKNVLQVITLEDKILKKHQLTPELLNNILTETRKKLFAEREKRIRPGLDDKILTSWNALMLMGYVDAYRALGEKAYLETAIKNANFLSKNMLRKDFRLNRNYKDGKSVINAFLDDYALLAEAFINLYQVTFDEQWLKKAEGLVNYATQYFFDEEDQMYFYTSSLDPPLVARKKVLPDNVISGSNSIMARVLYDLGLYLYNEEYLAKAKQMMSNMSTQILMSDQPYFYANWTGLFLDLVRPPYEVAIVGENYKPLQQQLMSYYLPNAILLGGKQEGSLELLKNKLIEDETRIYVCQDKICKLPVGEVDKALELMQD